MRIAIVGANSGVGTELSLLAREVGHTVNPIVRSFRSAWFLEHCGFDCTIGALARQDQSDVFLDPDVVVIAAFAGQMGRDGLSPNKNSKKNQRIIKNTVSCSPEDAAIVYLSTIHAFGGKVGPNYFSWYGLQKRKAEKTLHKEGKKKIKNTYALRLGHVIGELQYKREKLVDTVRNAEKTLKVPKDKKSNVVNVVSILDALRLIYESEFENKTYTLVNTPNWTWENLLMVYNVDLEKVNFSKGDGENKNIKDIIKKILKKFYDKHTLVARSLFYLVPDEVPSRLRKEFRKKRIKQQISELTQKNRVSYREFEYGTPPGPTIDGLEDTVQLLEAKPSLSGYIT